MFYFLHVEKKYATLRKKKELVMQLNINPGYNEELVKSCKTLWEYVQYVERVRRYSTRIPLKSAVEKAVDECIREGILVEFLRKNRAEKVTFRSVPTNV